MTAGELPRERGVPEEPEESHQDAGLRHRDVRRVLAPHPGQRSHSNDWKDIFHSNIRISYSDYFALGHQSLSDNFNEFKDLLI